jgi:hypothetical protein
MAATPPAPLTSRAPESPATSRPSAALRRLHARLLAQADLLVALAAAPEEGLWRVAEEVSGWSVAQHLEHLMLADHAVLDRLDELLAGAGAGGANGTGSAGAINVSGRLVLFFNYIPRGSARATTPIQPKSTSVAPIRAGVAEVRRRLGGLGDRLGGLRLARGTARHLRFGGLDARQWVRFLEVHNHHHLKIVRDVQRALARPAGARPAGRPRWCL